MERRAIINEIDLVVADLPASVDFYRRLGVELPRLDDGALHARGGLENAVGLHLHTETWTRVWNRGWRGPNRALIGFHLDSRDEVDSTYEEMTRAGYRGLQPPSDAYWGARYAVIEDPSGVGVGLSSPIDPGRRVPPPQVDG